MKSIPHSRCLNGLPNISRSALELIGSREITTQELAGALQITAANTNRFLNALQQNGFAQIVGEKKSLMKGRPSRIYRLEL